MFLFVGFREEGEGEGREGGEREKERERERNINLLFHVFIHLFLYVSWPGIKHATLVYRVDALTNWAILLGDLLIFQYLRLKKKQPTFRFSAIE